MRLKSARLAILVLLFPAAQCWGQASDAALRDRVLQLIERLEAPKIEARKAAEEALVKLGPRILPLLPESAKVTGEERKQRVERVRASLLEARAADQSNLGASRITIQEKGIRLTEVLKKLQAQSGNMINDVREQEGAEVTNPALDLDIAGKSFFEALDEVCQKAEVTPNFFTGDGSIGLMAGKP